MPRVHLLALSYLILPPHAAIGTKSTNEFIMTTRKVNPHTNVRERILLFTAGVIPAERAVVQNICVTVVRFLDTCFVHQLRPHPLRNISTNFEPYSPPYMKFCVLQSNCSFPYMARLSLVLVHNTNAIGAPTVLPLAKFLQSAMNDTSCVNKVRARADYDTSACLERSALESQISTRR